MSTTNSTQKRGRGRPRFEPTDYMRKQVKSMAGIGLPQDDIARVMGITAPTLRRHFRTELNVGQADTINRVAQSLVSKALGGNVTAQIFFLKVRAGWKETQVHEHRNYDYENMSDEELARVAGEDLDGNPVR